MNGTDSRREDEWAQIMNGTDSRREDEWARIMNGSRGQDQKVTTSIKRLLRGGLTRVSLTFRHAHAVIGEVSGKRILKMALPALASQATKTAVELVGNQLGVDMKPLSPYLGAMAGVVMGMGVKWWEVRNVKNKSVDKSAAVQMVGGAINSTSAQMLGGWLAATGVIPDGAQLLAASFFGAFIKETGDITLNLIFRNPNPGRLFVVPPGTPGTVDETTRRVASQGTQLIESMVVGGVSSAFVYSMGMLPQNNAEDMVRKDAGLIRRAAEKTVEGAFAAFQLWLGSTIVTKVTGRAKQMRAYQYVASVADSFYVRHTIRSGRLSREQIRDYLSAMDGGRMERNLDLYVQLVDLESRGVDRGYTREQQETMRTRYRMRVMYDHAMFFVARIGKQTLLNYAKAQVGAYAVQAGRSVVSETIDLTREAGTKGTYRAIAGRLRHYATELGVLRTAAEADAMARLGLSAEQTADLLNRARKDGVQRSRDIRARQLQEDRVRQDRLAADAMMRAEFRESQREASTQAWNERMAAPGLREESLKEMERVELERQRQELLDEIRREELAQREEESRRMWNERDFDLKKRAEWAELSEKARRDAERARQDLERALRERIEVTPPEERFQEAVNRGMRARANVAYAEAVHVHLSRAGQSVEEVTRLMENVGMTQRQGQSSLEDLRHVPLNANYDSLALGWAERFVATALPESVLRAASSMNPASAAAVPESTFQWVRNEASGRLVREEQVQQMAESAFNIAGATESMAGFASSVRKMTTGLTGTSVGLAVGAARAAAQLTRSLDSFGQMSDEAVLQAERNAEAEAVRLAAEQGADLSTPELRASWIEANRGDLMSRDLEGRVEQLDMLRTGLNFVADMGQAPDTLADAVIPQGVRDTIRAHGRYSAFVTGLRLANGQYARAVADVAVGQGTAGIVAEGIARAEAFAGDLLSNEGTTGLSGEDLNPIGTGLGESPQERLFASHGADSSDGRLG